MTLCVVVRERFRTRARSWERLRHSFVLYRERPCSCSVAERLDARRWTHLLEEMYVVAHSCAPVFPRLAYLNLADLANVVSSCPRTHCPCSYRCIPCSHPFAGCGLPVYPGAYRGRHPGAVRLPQSEGLGERNRQRQQGLTPR